MPRPVSTAAAPRESLLEAATGTHFKTLRSALLSFIDTADQSDLEVLSKFLTNPRNPQPLPKSKFRSSIYDPLHCVRCHQTYTLRDNVHQGACTVAHVFDSESPRLTGSVTGSDNNYEYSAVCCNGTTLVDEGCGTGDFKLNKTEPRYCYIGLHTTDRSEVIYKPYSTVECRPGNDGECTRATRDRAEEPTWVWRAQEILEMVKVSGQPLQRFRAFGVQY